MKTNVYLKTILGAATLTALYFLYHLFLSTDKSLQMNNIIWELLSNILVVGLIAFYISQTTLKGMQLALAVFAIYYIIGNFNILIEAYIFNVTDRNQTVSEMIQGLVVAAIFAPLLVYIFGKWKGTSIHVKFQKFTIFKWVWKISLGIILYLFFYLAAGMILQGVYPALMDFYGDKIPEMGTMILTQIPRGMLFILVSLIVMGTLEMKFFKIAILIGLIFSIVGGVAPLIPPNVLMPPNIRLVHGIEVGISNFLFGYILSYLFKNK